jgi:hypothetical protein
VIDSRNLQAKERRTKMEELTEYLEEKRVPPSLNLAIKDAYRYYLSRRPGLAEKGLFDILPQAIRLKLIERRHRNEIESIPLLRNSELAFVADLLEHAIPYQCHTGDVIYSEGDVADQVIIPLGRTTRFTEMMRILQICVFAVSITYVLFRKNA